MKTMILSITVLFSIVLTGYAEEQTEFAFNLYRAALKDKPNENVSVSPYCAELLLDFVRAGAAGETNTEIDKVLGRTEAVQWNEAAADSPLLTAAALWAQQGHPILPEFLKTAREKFGASVEQADFIGNANEAVKRINAW
jgi:serine protease inhibitor